MLAGPGVIFPPVPGPLFRRADRVKSDCVAAAAAAVKVQEKKAKIRYGKVTQSKPRHGVPLSDTTADTK